MRHFYRSLLPDLRSRAPAWKDLCVAPSPIPPLFLGLSASSCAFKALTPPFIFAEKKDQANKFPRGYPIVATKLFPVRGRRKKITSTAVSCGTCRGEKRNNKQANKWAMDYVRKTRHVLSTWKKIKWIPRLRNEHYTIVEPTNHNSEPNKTFSSYVAEQGSNENLEREREREKPYVRRKQQGEKNGKLHRFEGKSNRNRALHGQGKRW